MGHPRRRLQPDERREELLKAAETLLRRGGTVRVEDVVAEARAAKGTFYVYFATWDDLLEAVRARIFAAFQAAHPIAPARAPADLADVVERVAVAFVDFTVGLEGLHDAIFHSDFAQRRPMPPGSDAVARLEGFLRAGQKAGDFPAFDAEYTARLLFAVIHETADAVIGGADRKRALIAMRRILRRALEPQ